MPNRWVIAAAGVRAGSCVCDPRDGPEPSPADGARLCRVPLLWGRLRHDAGVLGPMLIAALRERTESVPAQVS